MAGITATKNHRPACTRSPMPDESPTQRLDRLMHAAMAPLAGEISPVSLALAMAVRIQGKRLTHPKPPQRGDFCGARRVQRIGGVENTRMGGARVEPVDDDQAPLLEPAEQFGA